MLKIDLNIEVCPPTKIDLSTQREDYAIHKIPLEPSGVAIYINFIATEQPKHGGVWDVLVIPNPVFNRKLGKICGIERMRKC